MGGLTSVASAAVQLLGAANSLSGSRSEANQARRQNELAMQSANEQAALHREQIRLTAEQAETERRSALKRAIAKQRAQFGADGIGSGGGSSQAVLLGLFDESEEERAQRDSLDALKNAGIDQSLGQQSRVNTLQLTQLRERNRLSDFNTLLRAGNSLLS